jgi:transposase
MNAVGIDVSKGKSMVAIMRPFGEIVSTPFEIKHTTSDIHSLEIGDVSRFTHKGAITAFAGVDPGVNESGTYEQKSVPTSKRGFADLRKTLFQVMDVLIKMMPQDDPVYQFLDKKRSQGKPYYVYMTAGANKFIRIYYGRVKEYLASLPES